MNIQSIITFEYVKTAGQIAYLKAQAFQTAEVQEYGYFFEQPDGTRTYGVKHRPEEDSRFGKLRFGKCTFLKVVQHMSPKEEALWEEYQYTRARARMLNACTLLLKRDGDLSSQARTRGQQSRLRKKASKYLHKVENRLSKQPERYTAVGQWVEERNAQRAARAAA